MMKKTLMLMLFAAPVWAAPPQVAQTEAGDAFVDINGMTLYTFDKDADGTSACTGPCLKRWPAAMAEEGDGATSDFGVLTREDGARQWTFHGQPLYRWVLDLEPGQATGDGVGGVWHVAHPPAAEEDAE